MKALAVMLCLLLLPAAARCQDYLADSKAWSEVAVRLSELALVKAGAPDVQYFAAALRDHHIRMITDYLLIARHRSVTLPASLPDEASATLGRLAELSREAFDDAYLMQVLALNRAMTNASREQIRRNADLQLVMLAEQSLVFLDIHRTMAARLVR